MSKNNDEYSLLIRKVNENDKERTKRIPNGILSPGVIIEDLIFALQIFSDDSIKNKAISFSLDPSDQSNPESILMKKVYWPDLSEKKMILEGTKFGEIMFDADYLMKEMSLGIKTKNKKTLERIPFDYPEELAKKGLKAHHEFADNTNF